MHEQVPKENPWQAEATKVRQEEHAEYLKASKDFKDSAAAVAKAIDVLNEYYSSASFVQASSGWAFDSLECLRVRSPGSGGVHLAAGVRWCERGRWVDDHVGAGGR